MYTRCTQCKTLFRITRDHLHAARGQVRCGRCGITFDALQTLREELPDGLLESGEALPEALHAVAPDPVEEDAPDDAPFEAVDATPVRRWPWMTASILLALVLALQAVHFFREPLSRHPQAGPMLQTAYEFAGMELTATPRDDLEAFVLLHHEMVSHPRLDGGLHLSGVLVNRAGFAQPWPLLELRLEDRFGAMVAARRLTAEEYLRNPPQDGELMPAHARRPIEIEFVDPGSDAVGFSIDFCIESRAGLRCASHPPSP